MKIALIHLSDLHFRLNWEEEQSIVLNEFFKDLSKQISSDLSVKNFLVFSGDIVQKGGNKQLYDAFYNQFNSELNKLNITKNQRICVPGNHDISTEYIKNQFEEHEGVLKLEFNESQFNDYMTKSSNIYNEKFLNYKEFESKFANYGIFGDSISGSGWNIDENIGIYCLNTAICSSGGYNSINDKNRLAIDTRNIQRWLSDCKATTKILVMHHHKEWLIDWAKTEIDKLLRKNFVLCLSGHIHGQSVFHSINNDCTLIECSAPPLLTNKNEKLGYSIIFVNEKGVTEIKYRQWTKEHNFVTGVDFSNNDNGKIIINNNINSNADNLQLDILKIIEKRLEKALRSYSIQPIVFVDPVLSKTNDVSSIHEEEKENLIDNEHFICNIKSTIIKAPPQFGLSCLSHYLIKKAWVLNSSL
ncbi:MAG: metallophosphoesterase [Bacteroidetes bacterium]|nr:metallophosphoesterase [Bacteroidota bacterium]